MWSRMFADTHLNFARHFKTTERTSLLLSALICALFVTGASSAQTVDDNLNPNTLISTEISDSRISFSDSEISLISTFGPWPQPAQQDPGNELSGLLWAEQLGERLFTDPELSATGELSCSSCHQSDKGFADGLKLAQGIAQHKRNTQGLLDIALQRWFGWDGGTDSLWAASLRPLLSPIEMGADIPTVAYSYRKKDYVANAFSSPNAGIQLSTLNDEQFVVLLSKAIAAYTRTLRSNKTAFDGFRTALVENDATQIKRYPASAKRGLKLFFGEANCHICHFGPNFSNGEFHDTGRPFFTGVGEIDSGRYAGLKRVRADKFNLLGIHNSVDNDHEKRKTRTATLGQVNFGQWRTPSLRNLTLTGPYMHDGSLDTLRDVIDAYADIDPDRLHAEGESILKPLNLSNDARNDLVEFLKSLSPTSSP